MIIFVAPLKKLDQLLQLAKVGMYKEITTVKEETFARENFYRF